MSSWPYTPTPYDDLFKSYGAQYGVDPRLLRTVSSIESDFNINAISPKGARGLMQFMPDTGAMYGMGDTNWQDPKVQVESGAKHLQYLMNKYGGDSELALAAYNMGEGNMAKYGNDWSRVPETKDYIERYRTRYGLSEPRVAGYTGVDGSRPVSLRPQVPGQAAGVPVPERGDNELGSIVRSITGSGDPTPGTPIQATTGSDPLGDIVRRLTSGLSAGTSGLSAGQDPGVPVRPGSPGSLRAPVAPTAGGDDGLSAIVSRLAEDRGGVVDGAGVPERDGAEPADLSSIVAGLAGLPDAGVGLPGVDPSSGEALGADAEPGAPYSNPFPKGSRAYFEHAYRAGGLPAIRSPLVEEGAFLPGTTDPQGGNWGEVDATYPIQFKGRVARVIDADTFEVEEMGTGELFPLRLSDVNAAESHGAAATPEGIAAAAWMRDAIQPGSQITVETEARGELSGDIWRGAYGRPLGKAYVRTADGRTIDLSSPVPTGNRTVRDDFLDSSEVQGLKGTLKGLGAAALLDPVELAEFVSRVGEWVGLNDIDEGAWDAKLSDLDDRLSEMQHRFVSGGYDPERKTYNVPALGPITVGELGRGVASATAYTLGLTWILGKVVKTGKAATRVTKFMRGFGTPERAADLAMESAQHLQRLRSIMGKDLVLGVDNMAKVDGFVRRGEALTEELETVIKTVKPPKGWGEMSAVERLVQLKDLWIHFSTDKYHPLIKMAGKLDEGDEGMRMAVNMLRAAGDASRAPLDKMVIRYARESTGEYVAHRVDDALADIWGFTDGEVFNHAGAYMQAERMVNDIWPRIRKRTVELQKAGKSTKAIAKILKKEGMPDMNEQQRKWAILTKRKIEEHYQNIPGDPNGQYWEHMQGQMGRTREWMNNAILKPLLEIGEISHKEYDDILAVGGSYAPYTRLNLDLLDRLLGPEGAMEVIRMENEMLQGSAKMKIAGKGISDKAVAKKPIGRLGKAFGPRKKAADDVEELFELPDPGDMVMDMWQAITVRVPALTKYVNQQRVRNMLGDTIDTLMKEGDDWLGKTIKRVARSEDPKLFNKVAGGAVGNAFIRNIKKVDGTVDKEVIVTFDKALGAAIEAMSPSQMSLFKKIMTNPAGRALTAPTRYFRAGTVLGMNFMVRNPVRDQLMAATLTKYGYVPVVDFWRGMFHVLTESPLYKAMHAAGGSQSGFHAQDIESTNRVVADLISQERFPDILRDAFRPDVEGSRALHTIKTLANPRRIRAGLKEQYASAVRSQTSKFDNPMKKNWKMGLYGLRSISELFEEATRVGAVNKALKKAAKGKRYTVARAVDEAVGGMSGWGRLLTGRADYSELGARYQKARYVPAWQQRQAKRAVELGETPSITAAMQDEMRNITLDFNKNGALSEVMNAFYPFFNAEMQDYSRFIRAMREAPLTTSMRAFAFISVPAIANWYLNFDNPKYQAMGDVEKELFIHPFGYNEEYKKFGRISRPIGTVSGMFGLLPHKMLDWMAANDPQMIKVLEEELWPGKNMRTMRDQFTEGMATGTNAVPEPLRHALGVASMGYFPAMGSSGPVDPADRAKVEGDPFSLGTPVMEYMMNQAREYAATQTAARIVVPKTPDENVIARWAPQFISPLAKIMGNYDWFYDAPVTPPRLEQANLLPQDIWTEQTMPLERLFSQAINAVMPFELNPIEAGFAIRAYTGGLGNQLITGGDKLLTALGVQQDRPGTPTDASGLPGIQGFWSRSPYGSSSKPVRELYDEWARVERVLNSLEHNMQKPNMERTIDIMREHPEFLPAKILEEGVDKMSVLHKARRSVLGNTAISDEERADILMQLDQSITKFAYEIMMAYNKIKRDPSITAGLLEGLP